LADLLLVFLKWPEPGLAKTRLIPALGPQTAAAVYRLLAEAEITATRPQAREYDRLLCISPADANTRIQGWFPGEAVWPQPEGDLGHRMAAAFAEGFERGAERVAIIGTDVPAVGRATVQGAFRALDSADVVLGPAYDGGYYLLALARPRPELFEGIAWSTPEVLSATRARADALGLRTRLLGAMNDVDTIDDVGAAWIDLEPILGREPEVRDAVARALDRRTRDGRLGAQ
jgi:rSAM/selenodomain-associated transferase 1